MKTRQKQAIVVACGLLALLPVAAQKKGMFNPDTPRMMRSEAPPVIEKKVRRVLTDPVTTRAMHRAAPLTDVTDAPIIAASAPQAVKHKAPQYALGDGTEIYGSLIYSNQWSGTTGAYGIYKFTASDYSLPELIYNQGSYEANGGGCSDGKKYYWNSYVYTEEMGFTFTTFCTYDLQTHEFSKNILSFINDGFDLQQITNAMTYDPTEGRIYALANIKVTDETGWIEKYYPSLSEIDPYTGFASPIAQIPTMVALAATQGGQLYAISKGDDASLYSVNKSTGDCIRIGSTGISADYAQSMTFDPVSGKLYWAAVQANGQSGLYEVDTTTGRASLIFNFTNNEEYTSLFIPSPVVADGAPAGVADMTAEFEGASLTGSFSITAPVTTSSGANLTGNLTLTVLTDGDNAETKVVSPGEKVTITRTLTEGVHSITAYATNAEGDGVRRALAKYVGIDAPAAVGNLKAEATADGKAHISWTAPATGRHDGYVDPTQLKYTVVRMPDETTVANGISATYFTDPVNLPASNFYYVVTPYCGDREGIAAETASALFGVGSNLPVSFGFNSKEEYDLFTIIDANGDWDGQFHWGGWMYAPEFQYAADEGNCAVYGFSPDNAADDWLITPPVTVEKGKKYRVTFDLWTKDDKEKVEVTAGPQNSVASQSVILPATDYNNKERMNFSADFVASESGNYYVGFHITSPKKRFYCFVSNIVVDIVPDVDAPAAVSDLSVTPDPNGAEKAVVSFTAPAQTIGGRTLTSLDKVDIYYGNDETPVHTANVAPGDAYSWTDSSVAGYVDYRVVAYADGKQGEKAETRVYVGWDTPVAVSELEVSDASGAPVVTWTAPVSGVNGGYINAEELTYNVYRYEDNLELLRAGVTGTSFTDNTLDGTRMQHLVSYIVTAKSPVGYSEAASTDYIVYGNPYEGEFTESFADATVSSTPWVMYKLKGKVQNWGVASYGTNPYCEPVDGDGGLAVFGIDGRVGDESLLVSPKLNLASLSAPTLSFYFYHNYTDEHAALDEGFQDRLIPEVMLPDGTREALRDAIYVDDLGTGWLKYTFDLSAYRDRSYVRISLHGITACEQSVCVDRLQVTNLISNDLQAYAFTGSGKVEGGREGVYKFTIYNRGAADVPAGAYEVNLLDGGVEVATLPGVALKSKEYHTFQFSRAYGEDESGSVHNLTGVIEWADDEVASNNASAEVSTQVTLPPMPEVRSLAGDVADNNVTLTWNKPDAHGVEDGFEEHVPFAIDDFAGYTMVDGDGNPTWGFANVYFENTGVPQSFMVFNPVVLGIVDKASTLFPYDCFDPRTGNQVLACFQGYSLDSQGKAVSATNDDWFISPEVLGGQTISFYAKSADVMQGFDKFEVLYSTSSTDTSAFKPLADVVTTGGEWEKHEFALPADARYFAIHCVSEDGFVLFIDDLGFVERRESRTAELTGYKLYRDGIMLSELPATSLSFADNALAEGKYTYQLVAKYSNGRESAPGNRITLTVENKGAVNDVADSSVSVKANEGKIFVENPDGGEVSVATADGKRIYAAKGISHVVETGKGIFVVRVGKKAVKVVM